jgi:hypothetical protein
MTRLLKSICLVLLLAAIAVPQKVQKEPEILVFSGLVENIQKANYDYEDDIERYHMIDYGVLKVCQGDYCDNWVRVAHRVGTAKDLKVGDIVCRRVRRTDRFREAADFLLSEFGRYIPEENLSDFIYAGSDQPCSCEGF